MVLFDNKVLPGWSSFQPTNGHKVWGLQALQVNEEIPTCGTLGHIFCLSWANLVIVVVLTVIRISGESYVDSNRNYGAEAGDSVKVGRVQLALVQ